MRSVTLKALNQLLDLRYVVAACGFYPSSLFPSCGCEEPHSLLLNGPTTINDQVLARIESRSSQEIRNSLGDVFGHASSNIILDCFLHRGLHSTKTHRSSLLACSRALPLFFLEKQR
jgi:hypothetical protein